jgi:hypothetical protein
MKNHDEGGESLDDILDLNGDLRILKQQSKIVTSISTSSKSLRDHHQFVKSWQPLKVKAF